MAIPTMNEVMYPCLALIVNGASSPRECLPGLQKHFGLTPGEMSETTPSGQRTRVFDRADWAIFHMRHAGLIERPKRGFYQPSEKGRAIVAGPTTELDLSDLAKIPEYAKWKVESKGRYSEQKTSKESRPKQNSIEISETPFDTIAAASAELDLALVEELLEAVQAISPVAFERLILDLLRAMGYGGDVDGMYRETPRSGDGGFDGVIDEDALGLDAVYIQAKRYAPDNKVGRPALQAFVGSLTGEGASKGVFVTTSDFSREAVEYVRLVQQRIVLINGDRLARLMIAHDVGVRARKTYILRSVDEDYFADTD